MPREGILMDFVVSRPDNQHPYSIAQKQSHKKMEKKQYQSPSVKVMEVRQRQVLCMSPGLNDYEEGSHSAGDMK